MRRPLLVLASIITSLGLANGNVPLYKSLSFHYTSVAQSLTNWSQVWNEDHSSERFWDLDYAAGSSLVPLRDRPRQPKAASGVRTVKASRNRYIKKSSRVQPRNSHPKFRPPEQDGILGRTSDSELLMRWSLCSCFFVLPRNRAHLFSGLRSSAGQHGSGLSKGPAPCTPQNGGGACELVP